MPPQQGNEEAENVQQLQQDQQQLAVQQNPDLQPQLLLNLPQPHYLGMMENSCHHCCGKFFIGEQNSHNVFTKCCFQGKVTLPPIALPSANIVRLFSEKTPQSWHFLEAMASWNVTVNKLPGRGPRVVTIHGQTYHLTGATDAAGGERPQYSQLYILDTNQALQERINDPRNANLQPEEMQTCNLFNFRKGCFASVKEGCQLFIRIRTSKFKFRLTVLNFFSNLRLNCSKLVLKLIGCSLFFLNF